MCRQMPCKNNTPCGSSWSHYALLILIWSKNYQYRNFLLMVNLPSVFLLLFWFVIVLFCFAWFYLFIYLFIFWGAGGGVRIPVHFPHNRLQDFSVLWKKFRFQLRTFGVTVGGGGVCYPPPPPNQELQLVLMPLINTDCLITSIVRQSYNDLCKI